MYITILKHQLNNYTNLKYSKTIITLISFFESKDRKYIDIIGVATMFLSLQIVQDIEESRKFSKKKKMEDVAMLDTNNQ